MANAEDHGGIPLFSTLSAVSGMPDLKTVIIELASLADKLNKVLSFDHPASEILTAKVRSALKGKHFGHDFSVRAASIGIKFEGPNLLVVDQRALKQALYSKPQETVTTVRELIEFLRQELQCYIDPITGSLISLSVETRRAIQKKSMKEEKEDMVEPKEVEKRIHLVEVLLCSSNQLIDRLTRHLDSIVAGNQNSPIRRTYG